MKLKNYSFLFISLIYYSGFSQLETGVGLSSIAASDGFSSVAVYAVQADVDYDFLMDFLTATNFCFTFENWSVICHTEAHFGFSRQNFSIIASKDHYCSSIRLSGADHQDRCL